LVYSRWAAMALPETFGARHVIIAPSELGFPPDCTHR
jgi:hypothetical protein